jgi:hypothetical protein
MVDDDDDHHGAILEIMSLTNQVMDGIRICFKTISWITFVVL